MMTTSKSWNARSSAWLFASVFLLALLLGASGLASAQQDVAAQVFARINAARAENGLPPYTRNPQLDVAAQQHADDILQNGAALGHRGSDGSSPLDRALKAGYGSTIVSENWAGYRTVDLVMSFWLTDPPHRRNVLSPKFRDIGIGVASRPGGGYVIVTDLGAPQGSPPVAAAQSAPAAKKAQPTRKPTKPKPTAKPTPKPTRKPTAKPTAVPKPPPQPTRVALAVSSAQAPPQPLRARGKSGISRLQANADANSGARVARGDAFRMATGSALALGGIGLLGAALLGARRRRWTR